MPGKPNVTASPLISWLARNSSLVGLLGEAEPLHLLPRGFEPLAFGIHPAGEFAGKLRQRSLGARDRIVIRIGRRRQRLAQLVVAA